MAVFSIDRAAFTPSLTLNNWSLRSPSATPNGFRALAIGWGGRGTASTPYRTRWAITVDVNGVSGTSLTVVKHSPGSSSPNTNTDLRSAADTFPSEPAGIFAVDWDVHGGHGELFFPDNGCPIVVASSVTRNLSCINTAGTDANLSNYWVMWEE